jgi:hypothetical protein
MKDNLWRIFALVMVLFLAGGMVSTAQSKTAPNAVSVPVTGTFAGDGQFSGVLTINRFEQRGNDIVAVGFVRGVLSRGSLPLGTGLAGEVTWPVTIKPPATATHATASIGLLQTSCPVLSIALGPVDVDLLGFHVSLGAVTLDIGGESGTPVGDLVCAISNLLGNVAGVVNLLNSLLGLLTGLLGGLAGA